MRIKPGISLIGISSQMCIALQIADPITREHGQELVITAGTEGDPHSKHSKHRLGQAIDIRTRNIPNTEAGGITKISLARHLQEALGDEYYVLMEIDHIHIQYNGL